MFIYILSIYKYKCSSNCKRVKRTKGSTPRIWHIIHRCCSMMYLSWFAFCKLFLPIFSVAETVEWNSIFFSYLLGVFVNKSFKKKCVLSFWNQVKKQRRSFTEKSVLKSQNCCSNIDISSFLQNGRLECHEYLSKVFLKIIS